MAANGYIRIQKGAILEGVPYQRLKKRLQRSQIVLMNDPEDSRQKLMPLTALSPRAYEHWLKEEAALAFASPTPQEVPASVAAIVPASPAALLQPALPFGRVSAYQQQIDSATAAIPSAHREYVERWLDILAQVTNGTWKKYRGQPLGSIEVRNNHEFVRALAELHDVSVASIYAKLKPARLVLADPNVPQNAKWKVIAEHVRPKPRPGRSGHTFFTEPENAWMWPTVRGFYLRQAKLSMHRAHELLVQEIETKQRAWGIGHRYEKPTYWQTRTVLEQIAKTEGVLARQGEKAYSDLCAPYISRRNNLHSNELWVTDQKLFDVRVRDGGERLGRIWAVNVLDVATWRWLGGAMGPYLSSDLVMYAYAMALERAGVPTAVHMDLGKEFIGKRFLGGKFQISGEDLFGEALGLWKRLDVRIVKAIGRNPQSKIIERWHLEIDGWTHELPGWCGADTDERPEKLIAEEAAHEAWLKTGRGHSPLLRADVFIGAFLDWAENTWNRQHRGRGKYLEGMTPQEAWNTRLPAEGFRILGPDQVDFYTADRRFVKVARGGQVNLTFYGRSIEYAAPELFLLQGDEVEVLISRRNLQQVTVIYPVPGGTASCVAGVKPEFDWLPEDREELRLALRCRAALKRALKRGIEAQQMLAEARHPLELVEASVESKLLPASFGNPTPQHPETGSLEYLSGKVGRREKPRFANERAAAVLEALGEEDGNQSGK